jgi:ABC-2 type transport system permease protein
MVPAMWLLAGATLLLYGLLPRWSLAAWALVAWVFVAAMFGILLDLPQWLLNLSPFQHVPALPAASMSWPPIVVLTAVAVAMIAAGLAALDRRDLAST